MNAKISDSPILMLNIFQLIGGGEFDVSVKRRLPS